MVVAAESDRDLIHVYERTQSSVSSLLRRATVQLGKGEEPGRIAQGGGRFFVALRGSNEVAVIGYADRAWGLQNRLAACASPRGLAYDGGQLWVACLDGSLVRMNAESGEIEYRRSLTKDLRDIIITDNRVFVSSFREAAVFILDRQGELERSVWLQGYGTRDRNGRARIANAAFRMVPATYGTGVTVLHQSSMTTPSLENAPPAANVYYGGPLPVVTTGLTWVRRKGRPHTFISNRGVLVVDMAYYRDSEGENFRQAFARLGQNGESTRRTVSVAFAPDGTLFRQTIYPHSLLMEEQEVARPPGPDTYDTGHDLFFTDSGDGIACGSCHLEGADDSLTWVFENLGPRRTQDLRGGIMDTAPFHWQGDMPTLDALAAEVMVKRMGGPSLPTSYVAALGDYMDGLRHPTPLAPADPAAVERGRIVFESAEAACSTCHAGPSFTGPGSHDVGTGFLVQVPSLLGLSLRAPYMHNGCASTLHDRFDTECGGDRHGRIDHLSAEDIDDLVAYLESI